ncbi:MAG: hypothetical protein KDC67_17100, partial [Ignavibacteriae bacterium]|nr:hypothetical protein [Ignavibacteriota bacterium]
MDILVKIFLFFFVMNKANALIPLEGIIFGQVEDTKQYDPLKSVLNKNLQGNSDNSSEGKYYYGLYQQGSELLGYCEQNPTTKFDSIWSQANAARSVAATLQYIGLDISLKKLVSYAKKLEFSNQEFDNFASNLIEDTCSKNISVYSIKLLKSNFNYEWMTGEDKIRDLSSSSMYFSKYFQSRENTKDSIRREFEYTIRNFRAFCSWGGNTSDFRLLVPYLKNPFIMSVVFNNLRKKKISLTEKTKQIVLSQDSAGVQVACEDLICRKRSPASFNKIFPRMIGSTELKDDLQALYCEYFKKQVLKRNINTVKVKKWIEEQHPYETKLETLQF